MRCILFSLPFLLLPLAAVANADRDDDSDSATSEAGGDRRWEAKMDRAAGRYARCLLEGRDPSARRNEMQASNPAYIPRNHRVQQVIDAAEGGSLAPLYDLLREVTRTDSGHPGFEHLVLAPESHEVVQ